MYLKDLLSHELGPLPWSLASSDGSLAKTNKTILSKLLENGVECLPILPDLTTAVIIDAMAMLQTLVRIPNRFSELADMVMTRILIEAGEAARIDFVGDQYPANSIKNTERNKRGRDGQHYHWSTVLPSSVEKVHGKGKQQNRSLTLPCT